MGYFSNGTEGALYEEEYCSTCLHAGTEEDWYCPVWDAHQFYAYGECGKGSVAEKILGLLIPRNESGVGNARCRMYAPKPGAVSSRQLPLIGVR